MTAPYSAGTLALNAEAAHPPFDWSVELPQDWALLDTRPATWQRSLDRLVDDRFAGQRLRSAERREVRDAVEDLIATAQRGNVLISMVQLGRLSSGGVASAGVNLAWYDTTPDLASLATVRRAVGAHGVVEEHDTAIGPLLLQTDHLGLAPPGRTDRIGATSFQAFLPVPGTSWTAIVATAAVQPELRAVLRTLVIEMAGSIRPDDDGATVAADGGRGSAEPLPPAGMEQGFGRLGRHHLPGAGSV